MGPMPMMPGGMGGMGMPPQLPGGMMPSMAPASPYPPAMTDPATAMGQMPGLDPMTMLYLLQQSGDPMAMAAMGQGYGQQQMSPLMAAMMQMGAVPPQAQV